MTSPRLNAGEVLVAAGVDLDRVREALPAVEPYAVDIRRASAWFRRLWARNIAAVTMPWCVYTTPEAFTEVRSTEVAPRYGELIVHELAHLQQYRTRGPLRHVIRYVSDYLRGRVQGRSHWEAYRHIRLEAEARHVAGQVCAPLRPGGPEGAGGGGGGAT